MLCFKPSKLSYALSFSLAVGGLSGCLPEPDLSYPSPASLDFALPEAPINTPEAPEPMPDMAPFVEDMGPVEDAFMPPPDMELEDMLVPDIAPPPEPVLRTEGLHWSAPPLNTTPSPPPPLKGSFEWVSAPLTPNPAP